MLACKCGYSLFLKINMFLESKLTINGALVFRSSALVFWNDKKPKPLGSGSVFFFVRINPY